LSKTATKLKFNATTTSGIIKSNYDYADPTFTPLILEYSSYISDRVCKSLLYVLSS